MTVIQIAVQRHGHPVIPGSAYYAGCLTCFLESPSVTISYSPYAFEYELVVLIFIVNINYLK